MPSTDSYRQVARVLHDRLGNQPYLSLTRREVTELLRNLSGEANARLRSLGSQMIEQQLDSSGLVFYPSLAEVETNAYMRLIRKESPLYEIVEIMNNPNPWTDELLDAVLEKMTPSTKRARAVAAR